MNTVNNESSVHLNLANKDAKYVLYSYGYERYGSAPTYHSIDMVYSQKAPIEQNVSITSLHDCFIIDQGITEKEYVLDFDIKSNNYYHILGGYGHHFIEESENFKTISYLQTADDVIYLGKHNNPMIMTILSSGNEEDSHLDSFIVREAQEHEKPIVIDASKSGTSRIKLKNDGQNTPVYISNLNDKVNSYEIKITYADGPYAGDYIRQSISIYTKGNSYGISHKGPYAIIFDDEYDNLRTLEFSTYSNENINIDISVKDSEPVSLEWDKPTIYLANSATGEATKIEYDNSLGYKVPEDLTRAGYLYQGVYYNGSLYSPGRTLYFNNYERTSLCVAWEKATDQ